MTLMDPEKMEKEKGDPRTMLMGGTSSVSSVIRHILATLLYTPISNRSIQKDLMVKSEILLLVVVVEEDLEKM